MPADQAHFWSRAAEGYEQEFIDPDLPGVRNPVREALAALADPGELAGRVDVAVAVNSLVMPDVGTLEAALRAVHAALKPGGRFLGIVPAIDGVHYFTMLLLDRARQT